MSHRQRLASILNHAGLLRAALALRSSVSPQWLTVLTYHRFVDASVDSLFDDEVSDVTPEAFERQIVRLKNHYHFVGIDELCAFGAGKPLPPNAIAITFDDGYLDNHRVALPILARHGVKATFFLTTGYVGERRLYWWDRASYLVKRSSASSLVIEYPTRTELRLDDRRAAIGRVLRIVKSRPGLDLERFLDELGRAAGVAWSPAIERSFAERLLMSWDHVRELKACGMDVQSHTRTHRVLQTLTPPELRDELAGSGADLERELGERPRAVAYPVGNPLDEASPIRAELLHAGYEIGFTNGTGANPIQEQVDPFNIRRQSVGLTLSPDYLLALVAMPALAPRQWWWSSAES